MNSQNLTQLFLRTLVFLTLVVFKSGNLSWLRILSPNLHIGKTCLFLRKMYLFVHNVLLWKCEQFELINVDL